MSLTGRLNRLFKADAHAMLDLMEEPEAVLRQAIRDMEADIQDDEIRLQALQRELDLLEDRRAHIEAALMKLDAEIDLCFDQRAEDLVRSLIRRKLEGGQEQHQLEYQVRATDQRKRQLEAGLDEHSRLLRGLKQQAGTLVSGTPAVNMPTMIRDEDVEVAFLAEKARRQSL